MVVESCVAWRGRKSKCWIAKEKAEAEKAGKSWQMVGFKSKRPMPRLLAGCHWAKRGAQGKGKKTRLAGSAVGDICVTAGRQLYTLGSQ